MGAIVLSGLGANFCRDICNDSAYHVARNKRGNPIRQGPSSSGSDMEQLLLSLDFDTLYL